MKQLRVISSVSSLGLFCLMSSLIIIQAIFDPNGFVTSDSAHYLQLAQNIIDGNGLHTANYVDGMNTYFATWPVGYPLLIAVVAFILPVSVFWAAKIVNIICLGLMLVLLNRLFGERSFVSLLAFSISTFLTILPYTWSEVPFLLGLVALVYYLYTYIQTNTKVAVLGLFVTGCFLFFMRYIGLIGGGIIGLIGFFYLFRRSWRQMMTLWGTGVAVFIVAFLYLFINQLQTGLATGMERIPRIESRAEFIQMVADAVLAELNIFSVEIGASIILPLIVIGVLVLITIRKESFLAFFRIRAKDALLPGLFTLVGLVYFVGIVYMRATAYFDELNYRLIGPAMFVLVLAFVARVVALDGRAFAHWSRFVVLLTVVSLSVNIYSALTDTLGEDTPTYAETIATVQKKYEEIPQGSIVGFETIHARYIRPDLQFVKVHFTPYFPTAESVDAFVNRLLPNEAAGIYLERKELVYYGYGDGFAELMDAAKASGETFIRIH